MSATLTRLGKYDLVARIAKGGMAELYLARQRGVVGFSRLVVIKRILPHLAEEPQFVRMFLEEARLAALIAHPNVVQIFDVDQFEGHYYIAMEYLDGPSLGTVMRKLRAVGGALPPPVAAEIVAQAAEGLHAAHELRDDSGELLQLVHRDISPHNLMVTEAGLVKLVDFGIAKAQRTAVHTRTGGIKGKYPYMSPEQCRGEPLDRRTDLFSLGTVFFELVTGKRVFARETELMTLKAITEEPLPVARELRPELPEELSRVISRCLERERGDRYGTAADLARAVRGAMAALGEPTGAATLAAYLAAEHRELLVSRAAALQRAVQLEPGRVELLDSFESGSGSAAGTSGWRAPRPRGPLRLVLLSLLVIVLAAAGGLAYRLLVRKPRPSGPAIVFGLPPSFPAEVAREEMAPFLRYLERRLHRRFELQVPKDYHALRAGLLDGRLHFANLPPLQFVLARRQSRALKVLVSHLYEGSRSYQALLITRDDSTITGPGGLRGKRFCYVDPESTSGYLLPRQFLRQRGLDPDKLFSATRFSGNHVALMRDVIEGRCDAGALYSGAMTSASQHGIPSSRLRILTVAGQLPFDVLCAGPGLPHSLWEDLARALLELDPRRDLGRPIVGPTYRISGFTAARLEDFDQVEQAAVAEGILR